MYKHILFFTILCCPLIQSASNLTPWLEIKPSYFFFSSYPMKNIYRNGGFEVQGSTSVPLCKYLDFYGSIGYREVCGKALNSCEKTNLTVVPIDVGLKPIFKFCEHYYYSLAIGPRFFCFHQHNQSPYVDRKIDNAGIGFFTNTGFNVLLKNCLLFGIFGEYSYEKQKIYPCKSNVYSNGSVQIGGLAFGISLGYAF